MFQSLRGVARPLALKTLQAMHHTGPAWRFLRSLGHLILVSFMKTWFGACARATAVSQGARGLTLSLGRPFLCDWPRKDGSACDHPSNRPVCDGKELSRACLCMEFDGFVGGFLNPKARDAATCSYIKSYSKEDKKVLRHELPGIMKMATQQAYQRLPPGLPSIRFSCGQAFRLVGGPNSLEDVLRALISSERGRLCWWLQHLPPERWRGVFGLWEGAINHQRWTFGEMVGLSRCL